MGFKQWYRSLFRICKQLVVEPKKFWEENKSDDSGKNVVTEFFAPLVFIAGLAVFLGEIMNSSEILVSFAIFKGLKVVISYFLQLFIAIPVLTALQKNFEGSGNKKIMLIVLAYSMSPFLFASIITGLLPGLYVLSIIGLYGFYIFILGAQSRFELPSANQSRYIILSILLIILIFGIVDTVCWKLLSAFFPYGA